MKIKNVVVGVVVILVIASSLLLVTQKIQAQGQGDNADLSKKLDDVINSQRAIIDSLNDMKSELKIIKIRITQQQ